MISLLFFISDKRAEPREHSGDVAAGRFQGLQQIEGRQSSVQQVSRTS